jgi:cell division protein FtsQ
MPAARPAKARKGQARRMTAEALRPAYSRGRVRGVSKLAAARQAGLPAGLASAAVLLAAALISVVVLATGGRGETLIATGQAAARTDLASIGFRVDAIHLQGATAAARKQIIAAADLHAGAPILSVDLAALRDRVRQVGWVSDARVFRMLPGTLVIAVDQRPLMAVWQHGGRFVVVADNGTPMPDVAPAKFGELPLIVGDGANEAAAAILPMVAARQRLAAKTQSLVRVDGRRWNLALKDGGMVMLPATGEAAALARLDALDRTAKILDLGFSRIDLRDPEMVVVRPRAGPALAGGGV